MPTSHLAEFNASFPVILDHIASDIWVALFSHGIDAVGAAGLDEILPNVRHTPGVLVVSADFNSVLMRFFDHILDHVRFVVLNFYTRVVQGKRVLDDLKKLISLLFEVLHKNRRPC